MNRPTSSPFRHGIRHQRGATLIVALILLLLMSLLAASSLRSTLLQERMSSNTYDHDLAFQAAEAGLRMGERVAETWSNNNPTANPLPRCNVPTPNRGLYDSTPDPSNPLLCTAPLWKGPAPGASGTYWHDASADAGADIITFNNDKLSLAPYYIVELIATNAPCQIDAPGTNQKCNRFRVTAMSRPEGGRSKVVLQSIYATD
jgi:type IV pilus assembly protein PilX